ncbi:hypothetical protein H6F43_02100 [Leptolyngbya sp. FACHB-36]|uniref:hypothetical protein n=1 Tax=Leptolyngbya sp. FACHB-36 TaxID=2692808 RepID=UPI0016802DEA|nr:hypothetical protein [Leptolyngbya sp. FACHB-36]MBD2018978.1 hypothetical protein [Leptolyngbya sp. FACHB-36]
MSSEVIVYVVYDASVKSVSCQEIIAAIRSSHPRWLIEGGNRSYFAVGLYDQAPVRVSSSTEQSDQEEAQEMADSLELAGASASDILKIRQTNARFEIYWDFTEDADPVPETAEVIFAIAKIIVGLTDGVPLVNGSRLLSFSDAPWDQIIPS